MTNHNQQLAKIIEPIKTDLTEFESILGEDDEGIIKAKKILLDMNTFTLVMDQVMLKTLETMTYRRQQEEPECTVQQQKNRSEFDR